ncbi:MAG: TIGR02679 family protein, partial [Oscillospiraceae bacterium]|nr:TIGR02679 family protein [Oscillospiraceae bacterium]
MANECADYFRRRHGFDRIIRQILDKYQGLGRMGGTITLTDATLEECDALRGLVGRAFSNPLRISLAEFDAALQKTRFAGVTLHALLEAYFEVPIHTKQEQKLRKKEIFEEVLDAARSHTDSEPCRTWLDALRVNRGTSGGRILQTAIENGSGLLALRQACEGFACLQETQQKAIRLAVLSARATTDPHALDDGTNAGKLFLALLCYWKGQEHPTTAEARDYLFYQSGILRDSISSSVTQIGVALETEEGEHPAFAAFRRRCEACTLTLSNLGGIRRASSPSGHVYLVENQMVFSQLCDHAKDFHSPLICTSGQPQVAVLRLLDLLAETGTQLHYSGDFDRNGLSIAEQFWKRYPEQLLFWHMSPADYRAACSKVQLSASRLELLESLLDGPLRTTAQEILGLKR